MGPEFADQIRRLRARHSLTQAQLGALLGVTHVTVNRWENAHSRPRPTLRERLARLEQVGLDEFLADPQGTLERADSLAVAEPRPAYVPELDFGADPEAVRLVAEAERLSYGHVFNPAFGTEVSLIDPLPHQRLAVYERMLPLPRLRFLLADDAGAGKTIMTGLYVREMLARRLIRRVLVVPPAGLVGNWEREMRTLFRLRFEIVTGADTRAGNPFAGPASDFVIVSVDTLRSANAFSRLRALGSGDEAAGPGYDLVVFDEAHKLSADRDPQKLSVRKTARYRLAEALSGARIDDPDWALPWRPRHLLLLTATPHMGKDFPWYCLWRLLEPHGLPTIEAFRALDLERRARYFLRRTKEEMVAFDGNRIFPDRISDTLTFDLSEGEVSERALYDATTTYIRSYYNQARTLNRSAARLAMSVFQRRLASSTWALLRSLERRHDKLEAMIRDIEAGRTDIDGLIARQRRLDALSDPFEDRTADEESAVAGAEEHERIEDEALGAVVARTLGELQLEKERVAELVRLARQVAERGEESKFERLHEVLRHPRYAGEKFLVFTEHRDTLTFLAQRLEGLGFAGCVAQIHGGMDYREREAQVAFFRRPGAEGGASFLVATDAAGEGINLQFCWLMVNYDVPWNPARLEQRMGRIHRYKQAHDPVIILNLVAANTREGRVLHTLLEKLERIRDELHSDKVFDVVGRVFEGVSFKQYMELALTEDGTSDAIRALEGRLTPEQVKALEARERTIYGEGGEVAAALPRLREGVEREGLRRLIPGYVRRFVQQAAPRLRLAIEGDLAGEFVFRPLDPGALDPLWSGSFQSDRSERARLSIERPAENSQALFFHPGESVFDRFRTEVLDRFSADALRGAVFLDPTAAEPYLFHLVRVEVERSADTTCRELAEMELLESILIGLRQEEDGAIAPCPLEHLLVLGVAPQRPSAARRFVAAGRDLRAKALSHATEKTAAERVAARRQDLLDALPEREAFLRRGFDHEGAELAARRIALSARARQGDALAAAELEKVKASQRALGQERERAFAALRREPELIRPGEVRVLVHALVLPATDTEARERHDAEVERIAMQVAMAHEADAGADVRDVSRPDLARAAGLPDWPGFDLLSRHPDGSRRCIEVKGRARSGAVEIKENEWSAACNLRDEYWLYAVLDCATQVPQLLRVRDPFTRLLAKLQGAVQVNAGQLRAAAEV